MIIALYGLSCAGKTTLARELARVSNLPARFCGEEVMRLSREPDGTSRQLSLAEHQGLDAETRAWCKKHGGCGGIVEGRYLDFVLAELGVEVTLIRCDSASNVRAKRISAKSGRPDGQLLIAESDRLDRDFCIYSYMGVIPSVPALVLDTSQLSIEQCLEQLQKPIAQASKRD